MKWIATVTLLFVLTGAVAAAGPDDDYLAIYNQILQAETLQKGNQLPAAAALYLQARDALVRLRADHPNSNAALVNYRLDYLADKLKELAPYLPTTNIVKPVVVLTPQQQIAQLQDEKAQLERKLKEALSVQPAAVAPDELARTREKITAVEKERDLLSVALEQQKAALAAAAKPSAAGADSARLAADLAALKKSSAEADKSAQTQIAGLTQELNASKKKLSDTELELHDLKSSSTARPPLPDNLRQLTEERDKLKKDLENVKKDLAESEAHAGRPAAPASDSARLAADLAALKKSSAEADKSAQTQIAGLKQKLEDSQKKLSNATSELNDLKSRASSQQPVADNLKQIIAERDKLKKDLAQANKDLAKNETLAKDAASAAADKLKAAEKQRDDLKKQLAAKPAAGSSTEVQSLRARLEALEAAPVPYTPEELAVLKSAPSGQLPPPPVAAKESAPKVHSAKDLPPGAGPIMQDAKLAVMARHYEDAEKEYLEVLRQDPNNIFVLYNVGSAQFAEGHLDDCEKTVNRALALDPKDPGSLYLLGILRYGQQKLDDAFDALSRSEAIVATNAGTQFYLGSVLAAKGLRTEAETHLRKALEYDPGYADAHFNLALVYAAENPPSPALARWHYQKSLDLGHDKSDSLEKMLPDAK